MLSNKNPLLDDHRNCELCEGSKKILDSWNTIDGDKRLSRMKFKPCPECDDNHRSIGTDPILNKRKRTCTII